MMPAVYNRSRDTRTPACISPLGVERIPPAKDPFPKLRCKAGSIVILDTTTHQVTILNARCRTWKCPVCGPILRNVWTERIADARPERFLTLTCDPARWPRPDLAYQAMKAALPKLVAKLRQLIGTFEYCAIWELHESGYPHLHIAQRGKYVPKSLIRSLWDGLGIGYIVDIEAITDRRGAACYVAKYITKTITAAKTTLSLTKVIQYSKHFFPPELPFPSPQPKPGRQVAYTRESPYSVLLRLWGGWDYHISQSEAFRGMVLDATPGGAFVQDLDRLIILLPP